MTGRGRQPDVGAASGVVSIGARGNYRPDYKRLASGQVAAARASLGLSPAGFASYLGDLLGWAVSPSTVERWEQEATPPGDVILACAAIAQGAPISSPPLLSAVPPAFPAETLAGSWLTCYQFSHDGQLRHHADIAAVTVLPEGRIRAVNHPPEPRSEGRAVPFRNEIEAELRQRHLTGVWRNTSDMRYFGTLLLAVLPGETVMDGTYSGVQSDVEVSGSRWRWVRLDADQDADLDTLVLRDPRELYDLVMAHSQLDAPLMLADVRGEP